MTIGPRRASFDVRRRALAIIVGVVVLLGLGFAGIATFYTESLWFSSVGYSQVFWKGIWTRVLLGIVFGLAFAIVVLINLWIVKLITPPTRMFTASDQILERYRASLRPYMRWLVLGGSLLLGLFAGSGATSQWRNWLLFSNASDFGVTDQVFGLDLGFYVFRLPFHRFLFAWAFSALVVAALVSAAAHYFMGGIRPQGNERVAPEVRAHLSVLLGLIVLLKAWGYRLDQFNLLYSERGTVTGASFTDINAQLPALRLLVVIAIVCAVFFFVNARVRNWLLPTTAVGLLALTSIIAGGIYPAAVQRLRVAPNERLREAEFIERNINATREAYDIDIATDDVVPFPARANLNAQDFKNNDETLQNIRLWDPDVLRSQYVTLQRIKQYYQFFDVDIDRYDIGGQRRQVMLAAREIDSRGLQTDAQTWLNTHLVYTHGYGVVASRVDRVTREGQPSLILKEIPPASVEGGPEITEPQIYFGEAREPTFVVAKTEQPELDFPQGDDFQETTYDGTGGLELGGFVNRAAFAWRFRDVNLLISGALRSDSRIIFRRNVFDRASMVAPYMQFDTDPYLVIADGRLKWVLDGYTTTDMFPYSQRIDFRGVSGGRVSGAGNYIRNAAKFVIDAKDGTIDGYIWDEDDPILASWMKIFPDTLRPKDELPPEIRKHVRYPAGLFRIQSDRYGSYHITDPDNFYSQEDVWEVALDPTLPQSPPVKPYYVLQRLPGEKQADFVLVRPFRPLGRENLTAYLVAHSDPDQYGRLVVYRFPKSDAIFGPTQIQARINQDTEVARQVNIWDQQGSEVIRGNLLIVPIEDSLLYVQPLYLQGSGSQLPELKRVVAVLGESVRMADTLPDALDAILGDQRPTERPDDAPIQTVAELLAEALEADRLAQAALRDGDFAEYGRQQQRMRDALERAAEAASSS